MNSLPPQLHELLKTHNDLLTAFSSVTRVSGVLEPSMFDDARRWAPESVERLRTVREKLIVLQSRISTLTADVAVTTETYQQAWTAYATAMAALPQRHPVTRDREVMAELVRKARGGGFSQEQMTQHLHDLGLTPKGPPGMRWTVECDETRGVYWDPQVPAAAFPGAQEAPAPAGVQPDQEPGPSPDLPHATHDETVEMDAAAQALASAPLQSLMPHRTRPEHTVEEVSAHE